MRRAGAETLQKVEGLIYLALFAASIPVANWLVGHVGTSCAPGGPCVVVVWPGVFAPSGVLVVGFAFVLRDLVQRRLGLKWALLAIGAGAALSGLVAPPALALASVAAFALSETADMAVFTPLQRRGLVLAVTASGFVGLLADSVLFLSLAFGSLDFLAGQVVGKTWALLLALPLIHSSGCATGVRVCDQRERQVRSDEAATSRFPRSPGSGLLHRLAIQRGVCWPGHGVRMEKAMGRDAFKGYRFPRDVILLAVRWYCRFPLSYRDVRDLLAERGVDVDATARLYQPLSITTDKARSYVGTIAERLARRDGPRGSRRGRMTGRPARPPDLAAAAERLNLAAAAGVRPWPSPAPGRVPAARRLACRPSGQ